MGASKRYKGKDCAYCGKPESTSTNDHVVPRSFFLDSERGPELHIPQVAACASCNNKKSNLEAYVVSSVLVGSRHPEADRYRREKIAPRLNRNRRLVEDLNVRAPPKYFLINGVLQKLNEVRVDAEKISRLLQMIVRGLYQHHFGKSLPSEMVPMVTMIRPSEEAAFCASLAYCFPFDATRITNDLGRGSFTYNCVQSPTVVGFTAWTISLHGNIRLYGSEGSADHWWCITGPTPEALATYMLCVAQRPSISMFSVPDHDIEKCAKPDAQVAAVDQTDPNRERIDRARLVTPNPADTEEYPVTNPVDIAATQAELDELRRRMTRKTS